MANLTRIEDALVGGALYTFDATPHADTLDGGWGRRSGTYTILGQDFGRNPFGTYAAPVAIRKLQAGFRVVVKPDANRIKNLELARDAIVRACAVDSLHLLVQSAGGAERVVNAFVTDFADNWQGATNFVHRDFTITWELDEDWHDRIGRGPHRVGDGTTPIMGTTALVMGLGATPLTNTTFPYTQQFHVLADGTDGLGATTVDDTGPIFIIHGPYGGTSGFSLYNLSAYYRSTGGAAHPQLLFARPLAAGETLVLDSGALSATLQTAAGTVDGWPYLVVRDDQPYWMVVKADTDNIFQINAEGTALDAPTAATSISPAWTGWYR